MAGTGNLVATIMSTFQLYFSLDLNEIPVVFFIGTSIFFFMEGKLFANLDFSCSDFVGLCDYGYNEYKGIHRSLSGASGESGYNFINNEHKGSSRILGDNSTHMLL